MLLRLLSINLLQAPIQMIPEPDDLMVNLLLIDVFNKFFFSCLEMRAGRTFLLPLEKRGIGRRESRIYVLLFVCSQRKHKNDKKTGYPITTNR